MSPTLPAAFPPDPVSVTCGPFRPIRAVGRGAHGTVFLAEGPEGRVALKVCPRPDDAALAAQWEREKRGWSLFSRIPPHPGLVRVFGCGVTPDGAAFWIAMELADPEPGGSDAKPETYRPLTLASVASAETALPLGRCLRIGERIASALEHLQRHHLLHRDVKPGNVLFVRGNPVLADAGLVVDAREADSLVGTPGYEPPEHHGTPQGDVFSLGRTLWRIGTGRAPEDAGFAPCAEADTSDPDFWRFLAIVGKATAAVPERRHRSAKALRKDLARLRLRHALGLSRRLPRALAALCALLLAALVWALACRPQVPHPLGRDPLDPLRELIREESVCIMLPEDGSDVARAIREDHTDMKEDILSDLEDPDDEYDDSEDLDEDLECILPDDEDEHP